MVGNISLLEPKLTYFAESNRAGLCSLNAVSLLQQLAGNAPSPSLQAAATKCVSFLQ